MLGEAIEFDNLLQLRDRLLEPSRVSVDHGDVVAGHRFADPVADLPADGQGLLVGVESLLQLPAVVVREADVVQCGGFSGPVADLPEDAQGVLEEVESLLRIPPVVVHHADVVQRGGFAGPVADLPEDAQGLLVEVESLHQIPPIAVHAADVVQRVASPARSLSPRYTASACWNRSKAAPDSPRVRKAQPATCRLPGIYGHITDDGGKQAAAGLAKALERGSEPGERTATGTATGPKTRLYEGSTGVDVHGRQVRRDEGRRQEPVDFSRPSRTPCARLGVKGSQVQILSARPLFGLVRGTLGLSNGPAWNIRGTRDRSGRLICAPEARLATQEFRHTIPPW